MCSKEQGFYQSGEQVQGSGKVRQLLDKGHTLLCYVSDHCDTCAVNSKRLRVIERWQGDYFYSTQGEAWEQAVVSDFPKLPDGILK